MKIVREEQYKSRIIDKVVLRYLQTFGAVCIEGPKWCGKTWTSSINSNSEFLLADPSFNFRNREIARIDLNSVLKGETPRLIDEWQEVPEIWDAVRYEVDRRGEVGQFILTGSSTPYKKGILHSGAGRIGRIRMRPMSLYESGGSTGNVSLEKLCNRTLENKITKEVKLDDLINFVIRGGWPGNIGISNDNMTLLPKAYIDAIIYDDVHRIDNINYNIAKMRLLLRSLARNECTTISNSKLLEDMKTNDDGMIDSDTVSSYLDVFERLFLLDNLKPYSPKVRSKLRIKQSEKRRFCDPSLACALLNITSDKLRNDLQTFGFMFESMCVRDLKIYAESFGGEVYHYQDYSNKELDAIIELPDGKWCAFEIKLGANKIEEAAKSLLNIADAIKATGGDAPHMLCVICGMSNAAYIRDDGVFVVPITELRE